MWKTNKIYEVLKLQIENLSARVENNEFQIKKLFEMVNEIKNQRKNITFPTATRAYSFNEAGEWFEIDKEGNALKIDAPEIKNNKEGQ